MSVFHFCHLFFPLESILTFFALDVANTRNEPIVVLAANTERARVDIDIAR